MDHDQRFKELLKLFFADFFRLFLTAWAARFDFTQVTWLDKEVFPDPPQGERNILDLVAQVPTREAVPAARPGMPEAWLALLHVEIESGETTVPMPARMFDYYVVLRRDYGLPVLPVVLFLHVGKQGIGLDVYEERFWEWCPLRFEYHYIGLPALDAQTYLAGDNWLGVALASLMRVAKERRAWLGAEAVKRVIESPLNNWQKFLLCECVQAYTPWQPEQKEEFDRLMTSEPYREVSMTVKTWYEQGVEKGQEKGIEKGVLIGQRRILAVMMEDRWGPLSPATKQKLLECPAEELDRLARAILKGSSLQELGLAD